MRIEFSWPTNKKEKSATSLVGKANQLSKLDLKPFERIPCIGDSREYLIGEIPGLSASDENGEYWRRVGYAQFALQQAGVDVVIKVDDKDIFYYAVVQERESRRLHLCISEAVKMLRATRSWLKNSTIAEIRQFLEASSK